MAAQLHTYGPAALVQTALDKLENAAGAALNKAYYLEKFSDYTQLDKLAGMDDPKAAAAALSRSFDQVKPTVRTDPRLRALR